MSRQFRGWKWIVLCAVGWLATGWLASRDMTSAAILIMKDGRMLTGKLGGGLNSLVALPKPPGADGAPSVMLIRHLNDDLRRTFVPKRQILEARPDNPGRIDEKFLIRQRTAKSGRIVKSVGPIVEITPFDEFGRRIYSFNTATGQLDVVQAITEITPSWTKVEGMKYVWDLRIATSSIPPDILHRILLKHTDPTNLNHQTKIARFYIQCNRFREAREQLEQIVKAFPDEPNLKENMEGTIRMLRQQTAGQILTELRLRRDAGQHRLAQSSLQQFPSEGVAGEKLQEVSEILDEYGQYERRREEILELFDTVFAQIKSSPDRARIEPIRAEIRAEVNANTLSRLAAFRRNADDPDFTAAEKLALAISGWLIGSDSAVVKLPVALSLYRVRGMVREYLSEPVKLRRRVILGQLSSEEGALPVLIVELLAHMKPAIDPPEPISADKPGYYELEVQVTPNDPPVKYLVQLPPEYDPYRKYPTVVTLNGAGSTAEHQIDWWAGGWRNGSRFGQASRHGYIVIAPKWTVEHQNRYSYSLREHLAVLNSLRDACRRFSIDTDRVFLSGHSIGGDAAWDIGLAHPDLWAGVIPIVAVSDRYCAHYWKNAKLLPFYVVCGELDGTKWSRNARDLNRFMLAGYNCTVVQYMGRGHEDFHDEVLRIFDWMGRFQRDFHPREFTCSTMRPWDNFFWWVEVNGLPPATVADPANWPPARPRPAVVTARRLENNSISVIARTGSVTVWLSPELLDFQQRVDIRVNGRRVNARDRFVEPDLPTLLEDVYSRGDRQHPFWVKIEVPTGRVGVGY